MLLTVADYISVGPIVVYFYLIYSFLTNPYKNFIDIILGFYILGADFFVHYLKQINYPKFMYNITRRPKDAFNCDILSRKGKPKVGAPGFPSGHMTTISLFAMFMILGKYELYKKRNISFKDFIYREKYFLATNILIILLTAWARYYKNCHTLLQILCGFLLGTILAYIFVIIFIIKNVLGVKI